MSQSFEEFFAVRQKAALAYANGDGTLVDQLVPHQGEGTFFGPRGDHVTGAANVAERYSSDAHSFKPGGQTHFEVLQKASDAELAFWTGYQVAKVAFAGKPELVEMRLRVTEVFRRIDGKWLMVHRHADMGGQKG